MAKVEIPYIKCYKDRHGKVRHYYRREGFPRVALPGCPGSPEFMAVYATVHTSPIQVRATSPAGADRTINALIARYYATSDFLGLKRVTQTNYRNILDRFREQYGRWDATTVQTRHLDAIFDGMADRPGAALNLRKRLNRVFRLSVKLGWRVHNPVRDTDAPKGKQGGFPPWTEADIAQFETYWPVGSKPRLALTLLLYTGQRRSDVCTMGRQHLEHGRISVRQFKGGKRIKIPVHPTLASAIESHEGLTFILTEYGKPFSHAGFTQWFVKKAKLAGVEGRTPHGLRKAAGRRLAEAGCTAREIAAVLGHESLREVETYTKDADQIVLADRAFSSLVRNKT